MIYSLCRPVGSTRFVLGVALLLAGNWSISHAEVSTWPQFLGPTRDAHADGVQLPDQLPDPFRPRLRLEVGAGYAGPVIDQERVVVFHRVNDVERLEAFDWHTGKSLWRFDQVAEYQGGYNPDNGPRAAPVIDQQDVFCWGASGRLAAVDLATGRPRWVRHLAKDYQAPEGYFGFGTAPLVMGDRVLVALGGRNGAGIVAVDRKTGNTLWRATDEAVSYASPIAFDYQGKSAALFLMRLALVAVDPQTGQVLFSYPFGKRGLTVTGATPVAADSRIFLTASYQIGAALVDTATGTAQLVWANDETLSSQYANPVYVGSYLYGTHGREDSSIPAEFRCVELATGRVRWSQPGVGVAHVIACRDKLLVVEVQRGDVVLLKAASDKYRELDRRHLTNDVLRAPPAIAYGHLVLRTWNGRNAGEVWLLPLSGQ
ncbi:MAG: alcohol dehydrogenase [Pirellulaceae bacterium]|nr:MAG: alcohol dehydrogenase [Pirellulaceae bacterium]